MLEISGRVERAILQRSIVSYAVFDRCFRVVHGNGSHPPISKSLITRVCSSARASVPVERVLEQEELPAHCDRSDEERLHALTWYQINTARVMVIVLSSIECKGSNETRFRFKTAASAECGLHPGNTCLRHGESAWWCMFVSSAATANRATFSE